MKVKHLLQSHLLLSSSQLKTIAATKSLPALRKLLDWSLPPTVTHVGAEGWLCQQFGVVRQLDWPTAPLAALGEGLDAAEGYWLHADPVYVHLLRDRIVLTDEAFADLDPAAAASVMGTFNQYFSESGLAFFAPHQNRWYLRSTGSAMINTWPRSEAVGANIQQYLPAGPESGRWRQRLNEVQMLLHEHPVNQMREQRNALPVNGIWLGGGGVLPQVVSSQFAAIWSGDALVKGLSAASGRPSLPQPASAEAWLAGALEGGEHLITPDMASDLERDWFAPMVAALKSRQLESLTLHLAAQGQVQSFFIPRIQRWKFWRRANPLEFKIHG